MQNYYLLFNFQINEKNIYCFINLEFPFFIYLFLFLYRISKINLIQNNLKPILFTLLNEFIFNLH